MSEPPHDPSPPQPTGTVADAPRRGPSQRRMDWRRRLTYRLGLPVLKSILALLWRSYRFEFLPGQEALFREPPSPGTAPCYWHQQHILCAYLIRQWLRRGFRAGFLISDSVDGEVPARVAKSWGAEAIRGSANRTGTAAMREMRELGRSGLGIVTTADGPLGPRAQFKAGVVLMARVNNVPMLPVSCAAEHAWTLQRWDRFMIPKPFSRVIVAIGEPVGPVAGIGPADIEAGRERMQRALDSLETLCKNHITNRAL